MSKWGWTNITDQYFQATELVHDNITFGSKVQELKKEWSAVRKLQHESTGLGHSADGSVNASDEWWEENNKVHLILRCTQLLSNLRTLFYNLFGTFQDKECLKLKDGLPDHLPEMDKMFQGVAVTGESSYVPGSRNGPQYICSDEDEDGDSGTPHSTPHSSGSKRSFTSMSTHSAGTSPSKKSKSPALCQMQSNMKHLNAILENKTATQHQIWADRRKKEDDKEEAKKARRKRVIQMAKDLGATTENHKMWVGVLNLTRSESDMDTFEDADEEGRRVILDHLVGVGN
jgi:hypothetical protein